MGGSWLGRSSRRVHRIVHRGDEREEADGLCGEDATVDGAVVVSLSLDGAVGVDKGLGHKM